MKKIIGILLATVLIFSIPCTAFAAENEQHIEADELVVTVGQLKDGITVLITINKDGTFTQCIYDDISSIPQPAATADGELEWAVFHLGFNNWTDTTNSLYFTVSADEPMSKVYGTAYVDATSLLFPKSYYNSSFTKYLGSAFTATRTLASNIDVGDETEVRIGFKNVILVTTAGDNGSFVNTAQTVYKDE